MRAQARTESAQVLRPLDGIAEHRCDDDAARGMSRIPDYAEFRRTESVVKGGARKRFGIIGVGKR